MRDLDRIQIQIYLQSACTLTATRLSLKHVICTDVIELAAILTRYLDSLYLHLHSGGSEYDNNKGVCDVRGTPQWNSFRRRLCSVVVTVMLRYIFVYPVCFT